MSNETSYTFLSGVTVPMTLRKDGTYSVRQQKAILGDIDARIARVEATLAEYDELYSTETPETLAMTPAERDELSDRWNDLHDFETELRSTRREFELNRAPILWGSTAWLAANNID
ncbi:hypothetical protein SEA_UTZCHIPS_71 [Microbacterium phage UtzChips]|nr:hypothetical protein SEA_UTZCHIPS_71 [Microbacterium phage UtzChips]